MPRATDADLTDFLSDLGDPAVRPLFPSRFLEASELYADLVDAACWEILRRIDLLPPAEGHDPMVVAGARGVPPRALPALRFTHEILADRGYFRRDGSLYAPAEAAPAPASTLAEALASRFPDAAVGAEAVSILVEEAPLFFSGQKTGEEILFSPARLPLWFRYFSNDNLLYSVNNALGAELLSRVLPREGARVLEVGGGAGSAAEAALRRLGPTVARYRFTEIVPTFARRGERAARAAASPGTAVTASRLDMTKPWGEQGIEPASVDAVYAVNCFHVAPDLDTVLDEAARALAPGGAVVVSECVRPLFADQPVYVELLFDFLESFTNVVTHPERRPAHGFLTVAAWRASFARAGLPDVTVLPDVERLAPRYPRSFVAALAARRA